MSDPRETLARIRAQADAAIEGPWEHGQCEPCGERGRLDVTIWGRRGNALVASWCDDDEFNPADAEFIAAARTTVPALVDALEAVLAIHRDGGESQGYLDNGHYGVIDHCCTECGSQGEYGTPWPCPTVKAITDALSGRPTANGSGEYLARIHEAALDPDHIAASAKVAPSFTWATDGEDPTNR